MVTTPPGWFGEAFRRACVFLRASAGVEGEKIVLVEIVMSMKYNFVFFQVMSPHSAYLSSFLKIHYTLLRFVLMTIIIIISCTMTIINDHHHHHQTPKTIKPRGDGPLPAPIRHLIAILASAR